MCYPAKAAGIVPFRCAHAREFACWAMPLTLGHEVAGVVEHVGSE